MTKTTESAVSKMKDHLDAETKNLRGLDYFELLEELVGHFDILIMAYKEEHPEDFA